MKFKVKPFLSGHNSVQKTKAVFLYTFLIFSFSLSLSPFHSQVKSLNVKKQKQLSCAFQSNVNSISGIPHFHKYSHKCKYKYSELLQKIRPNLLISPRNTAGNRPVFTLNFKSSFPSTEEVNDKKEEEKKQNNHNKKEREREMSILPDLNITATKDASITSFQVQESIPTITRNSRSEKDINKKLKKFSPPVKEEILGHMKNKGVDFSKSFFILDGTAMLYRAHYSTTLIPGYNKDSMERILIIFGSEVVRLLGFFNPKYIAISFDDIATISFNENGGKSSVDDDDDNSVYPMEKEKDYQKQKQKQKRDLRSSFRHDLLPSYKGNRKDRPAHILEALPFAKKLLEALGVASLSCRGYEADDIMATFAKWSRKRNIQTILVCQDKDLYQTLVHDEVYLIHPRTYELTTYSDLIKKTKGINAKLFPDYMALVGDRSDNIPGIKGIGPLTARLLLEALGPDYGLEQMYERLDEEQQVQKDIEDQKEPNKKREHIKRDGMMVDTGKRHPPTIIETIANLRGNKKLLRKKLLDARDEAFLYKSVITLIDSVPMDGEYYTLSSFQYRGPSTYAEETMEELGFFAPLRLLQETDITFDYF